MYKYDIAFSVAEEDLGIARQIAGHLRRLGINYYLYTERHPEKLGKTIIQITDEVYNGGTRCVLMITSRIFSEKYWAGIEAQVIQVQSQKKDDYVFRVKIDDTPIDGISKYLYSLSWDNNPAEIAEIIRDKILLLKAEDDMLKDHNAKEKDHKAMFEDGRTYQLFRSKVNSGIVLTILLVTISALFGLLYYSERHANILSNRFVSLDFKSIRRVVGHAKNDSTTKQHYISKYGGQVGVVSSSDNPSRIVEKPIDRSDLQHMSDYYVFVDGNNKDLNNAVVAGVKQVILGKRFTLTADATKANNTLRVILQTETNESESVKGLFATVCNYQFEITDRSGQLKVSESSNSRLPGFTVSDNLAKISMEIVNKINSFL
jgi:hypothetical protein